MRGPSVPDDATLILRIGGELVERRSGLRAAAGHGHCLPRQRAPQLLCRKLGDQLPLAVQHGEEAILARRIQEHQSHHVGRILEQARRSLDALDHQGGRAAAVKADGAIYTMRKQHVRQLTKACPFTVLPSVHNHQIHPAAVLIGSKSCARLQILRVQSGDLIASGDQKALPRDSIIDFSLGGIKGDLIALIDIQDRTTRLLRRINLAA